MYRMYKLFVHIYPIVAFHYIKFILQLILLQSNNLEFSHYKHRYSSSFYKVVCTATLIILEHFMARDTYNLTAHVNIVSNIRHVFNAAIFFLIQ